jgi:hypothetical protein
MSLLDQLVLIDVKDANRQLQNCLNLTGYPNRPFTDLEADAAIIALRLENPLCDIDLVYPAEIEIEHVSGQTEVRSQDWKSRVLPGARLVLSVHGNAMSLRQGDANQVAVLAVPDGARVALKVGENFTTIRVMINGRSIGISQLWEWNTARIINITKLTIWECSCANINCEQRHTLQAWGRITHNKVATAVKGPGVPITSGTFASCMYCALLFEGYTDIRLRYEEVEFKRCTNQRCNQDVYEGTQCVCGCQFDPLVTNKMTKKRLIVVEPGPPSYISVDCIRCSHRADHYERIYKCLPPDTLGPEWDNLFDAPSPLAEVWKWLHYPDEVLQQHAANYNMNLDQFKNKLRESMRSFRNELYCPLCGATGADNPNWKPSVVWVRMFYTEPGHLNQHTMGEQLA